MNGVIPRNAPFPADDGWFRPYFLVDDELRVSGWPEATARALGRAAVWASGRRCSDLIESLSGIRGCRGCDSASSGERACARLPIGNGQRGWIVWLGPDAIVRGERGSATLEGLLLRGALSAGVASLELHSRLEAIRQACGAADCELFVLDDQGKDVVLRDCVGADREAFLQRTRMPLGQGYPGKITQSCEPLCTDCIEEDDRFLRDAVKHRGIHTFIGVPLIDGALPFGYLGVAWKQSSIPLGWGLRVVESVRSLLIEPARRAVRPSAGPNSECVLRCFGQLELELGGRSLALCDFTRRKALDLLRHLVLARGAPLHRDVLVERLWPDARWDAGINRLHVTMNALRRAITELSQGRDRTLIQQRHGHYRLDMESIGSVDAYAFADAIDAARARARAGDPSAAIGDLERALRLYRGEFFADADDVAFESHRQHYRLRHREALGLLVEQYMRVGRADAAFQVLQEAGRMTPVECDLDLTTSCGHGSASIRPLELCEGGRTRIPEHDRR